MVRISRQTFMLNQLRLSGNFTDGTSRQGTINGNALLFVKSLTGQLPQIALDATASGTPANFNFSLQNELQLLDDLEITGNGTQSFVIGGNIRDFYVPTAPLSVVDLITVPHNVRKSGSSQVILTGNNTFGGVLTVDGGQVIVNGSSAAIDGAAGIEIGSAGSVTLVNGTIAVDWLDNSSGGSFNFNGGLLKVVDVHGDLVNGGGIFSPGSSPALSTVSGLLAQLAGVIQIEIGGALPGSQFDKVVVGGPLVLGGTLDVDLINGFVPSAGQIFKFLTTGSNIIDTFDSTSLPALPGGLTWQLLYDLKAVALIVAPAGGIGDYLPGDYNHNGTVDIADYTVWRNSLQSGNLIADGNFDGQVTQADYSIWKSGLGLSYGGSGSGDLILTVPEPATLALLLLGSMIGVILRRR
jgi:autotransporter-associated beta strand protein